MSDRAYDEYHEKVVNACVKLMGEHTRMFFARRCRFLEQYAKGTDPEKVAKEQQDQYGGGQE